MHFLITCMNIKNRSFFHKFIDLALRFSVEYFVTHNDGFFYPAILYKYALNKSKRPLIIKFFKICLLNSTTNQAVLYYIEIIAKFCKNKNHCKKILIDFINNLSIESGSYYSDSIKTCIAKQGGL